MTGANGYSGILLPLVCEAPDILCSYVGMSAFSSRGQAGIAPSSGDLSTDDVSLWLDVSRAFALDGLLGGKLPAISRPRAITGVTYRHEGSGDIDATRIVEAVACGLPNGFPFICRHRSLPPVEAQLLHCALALARRTLSRPLPGGLGAALATQRVDALGRIRAVLGKLANRFPALGQPADPRPLAAAILKDREFGGHSVFRKIAVAFAPRWRRGPTSGGDMSLLTPGEDFADKAFELLVMARLRGVLNVPGALWFPDRMRHATGKPVLEAEYGGEPIRMWFQTSMALPDLMLTSASGRTPRSMIPDHIIEAGNPDNRRYLLVDAKNYGSDDNMIGAAYRLIGEADARGMRDRRVLVVRPGESGEATTWTRPDVAGYAISIASMPLGPSGVQALGKFAMDLLKPIADI